MSQNEVTARIKKLEEELFTLKGEVAPTTLKPAEKVKHAAKFTLSYWPLLSLLGAVLLAVYVKFAFNIDYFADYRSISDTNNLSEFHREMGDEMIGKQEWQAAEEEYQSALEIDKNNMAAAYGIAKAQVFQPTKDEKYYVPEVVNAKLNYMLKNFPDDYLLSHLRANFYVDRRDLVEAKKWFEKSMQQNPNYSWNYVAMGYLVQQEGDFQAAIGHFKKALAIDPDNELASSNLGYAYLGGGEFDNAKKQFDNAIKISPKFFTVYGLADASWYLGDAQTALFYRKQLLEQLESKEPGLERFLTSNSLWMYNYMPIAKGDKETIKKFIQESGADKQRTLIYHALSIDYAMNKDFTQADAMFQKARESDKDNGFGEFFANRIQSVRAFVTLDDDVNQWLDTKKAELSGSQSAGG
ncbi:MAG: tetratricopeptide repeat protein [Thiothrix sp.]|uniref:tetratricopeptide repeat protein n=1 Tax=Thiothrix sp. TaxID=1032 RepID=UPI0026194733|nr:tetratricopeptide repeat protein [Thiothrix sp.]MDD5394295.1 tetratricopeptide repeat protein [Thiothrix sp.]